MGVAITNNKIFTFNFRKRWHSDLNRGMEALQASALPLGYATKMGTIMQHNLEEVNGIIASEPDSRRGSIQKLKLVH